MKEATKETQPRPIHHLLRFGTAELMLLASATCSEASASDGGSGTVVKLPRSGASPLPLGCADTSASKGVLVNSGTYDPEGNVMNMSFAESMARTLDAL